MPTEPKLATVFYDGACPLCRAEIDHYGGQDVEGKLRFIDVSRPQEGLACGLTRQQAMARFHVLGADGTLVSGAAAYVSIWKLLPKWRWAARLATLPGMMMVLEGAYRSFLPLRPTLSRTFGWLRSRRSAGS